MAFTKHSLSLLPRLVSPVRFSGPKFLFSTNARLLSVPVEELKKRYPDLSEYDPILDFRDDDTLPGGNPHAKHVVKEGSEAAPNSDEDVTCFDLGLTDSINEDYDYPPTPPSVPILAEKGEDITFSESFGMTLNTFKSLRKKVLVIRRSVNMTGKGKIQTFNSLVVVGNGAGGAGYGEAKASDIGLAVRKATERAIKNIVFFERYDGRTIFHDLEYKFKATKLKLFPRPPGIFLIYLDMLKALGFGVKTNHNLHEVCHCIGITDLGAKVCGSRNPSNVIKAFFDALQHQNTPENIAKSRGKKMVDVQYQYYGVETKLNV